MNFKLIFHKTKAGYVACYIDAIYKRFYIDVELGLALTNLTLNDIRYLDEPIIKLVGVCD